MKLFILLALFGMIAFVRCQEDEETKENGETEADENAEAGEGGAENGADDEKEDGK